MLSSNATPQSKAGSISENFRKTAAGFQGKVNLLKLIVPGEPDTLGNNPGDMRESLTTHDGHLHHLILKASSLCESEEADSPMAKAKRASGFSHTLRTETVLVTWYPRYKRIKIKREGPLSPEAE